MKILVLTFYYEPDLCAGSFRATAFVNALKRQVTERDIIEVVTTMPNRYDSYKVQANELETKENVTIKRIKIPPHKSGFLDQTRSFLAFFINALRYIKGKEYDIVFASSSRLFTAFLGAVVSMRKRIPLYLDIRDIFVDTMESVLKDSKLKYSLPFFKSIERFTIKRASKINLISEGFIPYFQEKYRKEYSFFPNGIDEEYLHFRDEVITPKSKMVFTYTGNIGEGQGLEKIIPKIAQNYENIELRIIGDGGTRSLLQDSVSGLQNVKVINPVPRSELIDFYKESDVLFLHLNDYDAFKKVLPSKIFEYGATYKPIVAGVDGYVRQFLEENLPDSLIFKPCNIEDFCQKFDAFKWTVDKKKRKEFIKKFSRDRIMDNMAKDVLKVAQGQ